MYNKFSLFLCLYYTSKKRRRQGRPLFFRPLDFGKAVKGSADKVSLFRLTNLSGHSRADFISAHHQHPAPSQLLPGDAVKGPLFIGTFQGKILPVAESGTYGDIS